MEGRFRSRILALFARRTKAISELMPELYLHGMAEGDFDLLGEDAPVSPVMVARLKEKSQAE